MWQSPLMPTAMDAIIEKVKKTIAEKRLIDKNDGILVCVSGGPDSMALLSVLLNLKEELQTKLTVLHLDHMLRGRSSRADANFVKKICAKLRIPFITESCDVKAYAKSNKMSIEEAAREIRYSFYKRAAEKVNANKVATGHTADDQAETVLMRLIKGTGSRGLSGIPYKRKLGSAWVIRPLLEVERKEIVKYLEKHKIPSRTDATNFEASYLRNKIRHVLLPILEKEYNPKIKESLNIIAQNMGGEFEYLSGIARRTLGRIAVIKPSLIRIKIKDLLREHAALRPLIVRQAIHLLKENLNRITHRHWQEIDSMLFAVDQRSVDLPEGIRVVKKSGSLHFLKQKMGKNRKENKIKRVWKLAVPGKVVISDLGVKVRSEIVKRIPKFGKETKHGNTEYVNGDNISYPLKVRTWRNGDRIIPFGMKSSKKLQDIFVDEKVPKEIRSRIPLIISGNNVLWVAGLKLSETCRIDNTTLKIIKLSFTPLKKIMYC